MFLLEFLCFYFKPDRYILTEENIMANKKTANSMETELTRLQRRGKKYFILELLEHYQEFALKYKITIVKNLDPFTSKFCQNLTFFLIVLTNAKHLQFKNKYIFL